MSQYRFLRDTRIVRHAFRAVLSIVATAILTLPVQADQPLPLSSIQTQLARVAPETQTGTLNFTVDGKETTLVIDIASLAPSLVTSIDGPGGQHIGESNASNFGGSFSKLDDASSTPPSTAIYPMSTPGTHYFYQLPSLGQGTYTIHFQASGLTEQAAVTVQLISDSPIATRLFFTEPSGVVGRPVVASAAVFDGGTPLANANISMHILDDSGIIDTIPLHDDGGEADGTAGDGLYSAFFTPPAPGHYQAVADISGTTIGGIPYQRQSATSLDVVQAVAMLTNNISDNGVDLNGNGLFESIALHIGVNVIQAGTYRAMVYLRTASGKTFESSADAFLSTGSQSLTVNLDANTLQKQKENGPYSITLVELLYLNGGVASFIDRLVNPGETFAYTLSQLERDPIVLIGTATDNGLDLNSNGLFDQLIINLDLDVQFPGIYQYSGRLTDMGGNPIDLTSDSANLPAGKTAITFRFSGDKIGSHGINGPYVLDNVLIFSANRSLSALAPVAHTKPYAYSQFESATTNRADVNADGQVDCQDLQLLKAAFGKRRGQAGFDPRTDVNGDGITDVRDLAIVSRALPIGTRCP